MKTYIVGNWKMNKTSSEAKSFMEEVTKLWEQEKDKVSPDMVSGIGAPATTLSTVMEYGWSGMILAAENMHYEETGAFTGELSAEMIKEAGANAVILGHSERRAMFNETDETVNKKTKVALEKGLTPIVCVGETLEQREAGEFESVIKKQIEGSLAGITEWDKVIIAYEPIWAIGTGVTATAEQAEEACKFVRSITNENAIIQYGGSVKPENVEELMSQPNINGALVGGASLDPKSFIKLLTLNK